MTTNLVRRRRQPVLATPELRRRRRLSAREHVAVYEPIWLAAFSVLIAGLATIGLALGGLWLVLLSALLFVLDISLVVLVCNWFYRIYTADSRYAEVLNFRQRRFQVMADRNRRGRSHRDDELARLGDVEYPRYSVWVEAGRGEVRLVALAHNRQRRALFLQWKAARTKKLWNANAQDWDQEQSQLATIQLGQEDALEVLGQAQLVVEQLEAEAYAQSLKDYQLTCMATALQPPPLSAHTRGQLDSARDDLGQMLDQLLKASEGTDER